MIASGFIRLFTVITATRCLSSLSACFSCPLRIIGEIATRSLPAFLAGFGCTLRIVGEIAA